SRAEDRGEDGADGIERLGEIEPALRALSGTESGDVWIGRDLEKALAAGNRKERKQKKTVLPRRRRRKEQQRARGAEQQAGEDTFFVTNSFHQPSGGKRGEEITAEESNLDERRLEIGEAKRRFEVRNENIVEVDAQRPQEKEGRD